VPRVALVSQAAGLASKNLRMAGSAGLVLNINSQDTDKLRASI